MTGKFDNSMELYKKASRLMPGGVNSPVRAFRAVGGTPLYFKRAKGSRFEDEDGNEFIDFCMSWGPLILGHADPDVVESVQKATRDGLSFGACHKREIEIAEIILEAFPEFEMLRLVNSGTEAVMTALRLARGITGRDFIVKFEGCYHGHWDGLLVKAGSGLSTFGISSSAGIPEAIASKTFVLPLGDMERVEDLFKKQGDKIAGVIIEPLPANNGLLVQRKEFLELMRTITQKVGAVLIFDEVISGFRLKFGGYGQMLGIQPDLVTLGKIIGGGMPVGAVMGKRKDMEKLAPIGNVYQAGTLSGNPVSVASGIATLEKLKKIKPYGHLEKIGRDFEDSFGMMDKLVRVGSILWLNSGGGFPPERADEISGDSVRIYNSIFSKVLEAGFYIPPSAYEVMFLSIAHSSEDVREFGKYLKKLLTEK